jgi:hypothetical protein
MKNVMIDNHLWFVKSKLNGRLLPLETYCSHNMRECGPLVNLKLQFRNPYVLRLYYLQKY